VIDQGLAPLRDLFEPKATAAALARHIDLYRPSRSRLIFTTNALNPMHRATWAPARYAVGIRRASACTASGTTSRRY
jgi:hypothetical protein